MTILGDVLASTPWVIFERHLHPALYDSFFTGVTVNNTACECQIAPDGLTYNLGLYHRYTYSNLTIQLANGKAYVYSHLIPVLSGGHWQISINVDANQLK
jgi:hypothetical protein